MRRHRGDPVERQRRVVDGPEPVHEGIEVGEHLAGRVAEPLRGEGRDPVQPGLARSGEDLVLEVSAILRPYAHPDHAGEQHRDPQRAEHDPVGDPAPVERAGEHHRGHHHRLAEPREVSGEPERDLAGEQQGDPAQPDARLTQAPEDQEQEREADVGQGQDALRQRGQFPRELLDGSGHDDRPQIGRDQCAPPEGRSRLSRRPRRSNDGHAELQAHQQSRQTPEPDQDHRPVVAVVDGGKPDAGERLVPDPGGDLDPLEGERHGQDRRPIAGAGRPPRRPQQPDRDEGDPVRRQDRRGGGDDREDDEQAGDRCPMRGGARTRGETLGRRRLHVRRSYHHRSPVSGERVRPRSRPPRDTPPEGPRSSCRRSGMPPAPGTHDRSRVRSRPRRGCARGPRRARPDSPWRRSRPSPRVSPGPARSPPGRRRRRAILSPGPR